jgi:AraC-like DNA-binding protein
MLRPLKISHYVTLMQSKGFLPELVLMGSGINPSDLGEPSFLADLRQCQIVVSNMMRLTGDQGLGFEVGRYARLTNLGVTGYAITASRTLRQATNLWLSYSNSLVGVLSRLQLEEERPDRWSLTISELVPTGFLYNFSVEEVLVMILNLGSDLTEQALKPESIEFSYPAPAHQALYFSHFKCQLQFNSRRTRIVFNAPSLDTPLRGTDEEFYEMCVQRCSCVRRQIAGSSPVTARLRSLLLQSPGTMPKLDAAASELGLSARSLRRHLLEEGTSYQRLIDGLRRDLATEYLAAPDIAPKEVAYLLGFRDANAFRRAFKSWTGLTIQEFCVSRDHRAESTGLECVQS